jgi:hypothetical protein
VIRIRRFDNVDKTTPLRNKKAPDNRRPEQRVEKANVIDVAQWRFIQHLTDLRNICDHHKGSEPSQEQVDDLVKGVDKIIKTVF